MKHAQNTSSPSRETRILLIEFSSVGHFPRFVRWVAECEACRSSELIIAGPEELFDHPDLRTVAGAYKKHVVRLSERERLVLGDFRSMLAQLRRQFEVHRIQKRTYRAVQRSGALDLVVLPSSDVVLEAIGTIGSPFGSTPWTGIVIKTGFQFGKMGIRAPFRASYALRERIFRRMLRNRYLVGVHTIDQTLRDFGERFLRGVERDKLRFVPDPTADHVLPARADARRSLGIPAEARVILSYGAISDRKGIRPLIECAALPSCASDLCVVLAGKQHADIKPFLDGEAAKSLRKQGRLVTIDRWVSDDEEAALLAACDCMWIAYPGFYGTSGNFVLAARYGVPCIVTADGVIGYLVKRFGVGSVVDTKITQSVVAALNEAAAGGPEFAAKGRNGMQAFAGYSVSEFQRVISSTIAEACPGCRGIPSLPDDNLSLSLMRAEE